MKFRVQRFSALIDRHSVVLTLPTKWLLIRDTQFCQYYLFWSLLGHDYALNKDCY